MKAIIDGIVYEGSEEEIRRIVETPPRIVKTPPLRPSVEIRKYPTGDFQRNNEGSATA